MSHNKYVISAMEAAVKSICSKCTYPIFYSDYKNKPDLVATAVAVRIGDVVYLITAAHAIKNSSNKVNSFLIGTNCGIVEIEGRYLVTEANPSDGIDLYDIALVSLSDDFVSKYELNFISEDYICPWEFLEDDFFVFVFGFPSSRNKQAKSLKSNKFSSFQYSYAGKVKTDHETFLQHNRADTIHTCMTFGKNPSGNKPIYPKGCSGGGIWIIDRSGRVYLDSVFIEYYAKTGLAFGTKIIHAFKILSQSC